MARTRSIKPGFFKNETLVDLGFPAMICFAGLWTLADREGRLEYRPKRIKAEIFPYSSVNIERILTDLANARFIIRYEISGGSYIAIPSWHKHEHPHSKEPESSLPAPDATGASPGLDTGETVAKPPYYYNPTTTIYNPTTTTRNPESPPSFFPLTANAIREHFPATDDDFVAGVAMRARKVLRDATDEEIAVAVSRCHQKRQESAGLYLRTVPSYFENKKTVQVPRITVKCEACGDTGKMLPTRRSDESQSDWLDRIERDSTPCSCRGAAHGN
jgi:hypothetical protein